MARHDLARSRWARIMQADGRRSASARRTMRPRRLTTEPLEPRLVLDSTVVFNEIMYNPAGDDTGREWIELHNQMAVNMDLSLWRLDGAVEFDFPEGTVIPGGGYLVIAADPHAIEAEYGISNVLGPFTGSLSNGGELIELYNNYNAVRTRTGGGPVNPLPGAGDSDGRRLMNFVEYGDGDEWPVEPDGSGASLAKINPSAGSEQAENWTFSNQVGGTPGARNFSDGRPVAVSQITDTSGNNRHGTPFSLGTVAEGFQGRAGSFDGASSYVQSPVDINPTTYPQMTFGAWVRSDTTSPSHAIIAHDDGGWDRALTIGSGTAGVSPGGENIWNAFNVQGHNLVSNSPSMNLVDRDGAATGVSFTVVGTISGFSNVQNTAKRLSNDYLFVNAGNSPNNADWRIAGLTAGRQYDLYLYGGIARDAGMRVDTNGDGSLTGETTRIAPIDSGVLVSGVVASATGQILGNVGPGNVGEGNWSGFQLVDRVTGQLISVDIQAVNGGFGQQAPLLQSGPVSSAPGVGYSAFAGNHEFVGSGIVPDTSKWAFVAGVFNQATNSMTLYIDRDVSTTNDAVQAFTDNATQFGTSILPTNIGRLPSNQWYFDGLIDNVFFTNNALTPAQITALRDGGSAAISGLGANLLAFYPFEDTAPTQETTVLPTVAINELESSDAAVFQVELVNTGTEPVNLAGMVLSTNEGVSPDYVFSAQTLAIGGRVVVDETTLGFRPADGDALFLFTANKTSVVDAGHVDNSPRARFPDATGRWLEPTTTTFGSTNVVALRDEIVINEIMYHGYPDRGTPPTPATYQTSTLLDWNANWRYNQVGQSVPGGQLPTNWATTVHPVDGTNWLSGPGIFGLETPVVTPINTSLTLAGGRTTYYFETEFTVPNSTPDGFELQLEHYIDDGAIFYLNGIEIIDRVNLPASGVTNTTLASVAIDPVVTTVTVSAARLAAAGFQKGVPQRLSVELHQATVGSSDILFGTRVHTRVQTDAGAPGTPYQENDEDWLELYNRSLNPVDLTGWALRGGVDYDFAPGTTIPAGGYLVVTNDVAGLSAKYPAIASRIVGNYSGQLSNSGELIRLEDTLGNPADEVRYYDSGRWPDVPDGGGSSLELRDPDADNAQPGAWAASNESNDTAWKTYTYRGIALNDGIGNDVFRELVLGLLDAGEVLLDDISVIERPDTAQAVQVMQNGSFQADTLGGAASKWRIIGNHSGSVIADPANAANKVLRLVATGATEDKHNHAETTFVGNRPIVVGAEYEISFKAKWISGSNQLNSRLYFNFLQKTTLIDVSYDAGTPGAENSRFAANAGPTYTEFKHGPVVPKAGEATTVSVVAADPDGVASLTLYYAVNSGAFATVPMAHAGGGRYTANVPGQTAGSVVQFYAQGVDALGAISTYPSDGAASRALYVVEDGAAAVGQLHNVRVIMTPVDRDFLYLNTNRMSNDYLGATVIYDESDVFYDVGAQLKGSAFGRFAGTETGMSVRFNPDQLFRGVHETISIERAGNKKELLAKHMYGRAGGGLVSFYDDVIRLVAPSSAQTGVALLSMARYSDVFLDETFENGGDGALYNMELLYNPNGTVDGNPESLKLNNPYNHTNGTVVIADRGDDKETYRWNYQMRNARGQDDYGPLIELMQAFSKTGAALDAATQEIIDVDQWMRTWAMFSLNGNDDLYTRVFDHNYRMFVRPEDGKIIGMPWDLDRSFQIGASAPLWGDENLRNVIELPTNKRLYYGHLLDMVNTTANPQYMTQWATHFGSLTGQSFATELSFITNRGNYVLSQLPAEFAFSISTADPLNVGNASSATVAGRAWINVRELRVAGSTLPLDVTWTTTPQGTSNAGPWADGWQVQLPVDASTGTVTIEAYDFQGNLVGTDTITISSTAPRPIVDQLRIVELMYNPPGNSDGEEFLEVMNISQTAIPSLAGVHFTTGMEFTFGNASLAAGERAVIVRDTAAFQAMYGTSIRILGEYTDSALDNSGEQLTLVDADGALVQQFTYDDGGEGWHPSTDGDGYSLVIIDPTADVATWNSGASWRPSLVIGGSPGADDTALAGDINGDLRVDLVDLAILQSHLGTVSGALRSQGDVNGDGAVDRKDAAELIRHFGGDASGAPSPAAAVVAAASRRLSEGVDRAAVLRASMRVRRAEVRSLPISPVAADQLMAESTKQIRARSDVRKRTVLRG